MTFPWYAGRSKPDDLYDEVVPDGNSNDRSCSDIFPSCLLLSFGIVVVLGFILAYLNQQRSLPVSPGPQQPTYTVVRSLILATPTPKGRSIEILVDDFNPQPYQEDNVYYFNRLEGDRGAG
jgi:hypothetical protein